MRSWLENDERANCTDGTARLATVSVATDTGVSVIPSGKCTSSDPDQPVFWKSEMRIASLRGRFERVRMLSASFSDGPKRVPLAVSEAAPSAACSRPRSEVARRFSSALRLKSTSVALSVPPSESMTREASALARCQRSP